MSQDSSPPVVPQISKGVRGRNLRRLLLVGGINVVIIGYYGLVASPVYVSHSTMLVTNPQKDAGGGDISSMLSGSAGSSSSGAYLVKSFAKGWDEYQSLNSKFDFAKLWSGSDVWSRYGSVWTAFRSNDVSLYNYYNGQVKVKVDTDSGQALYSVSSYDPQSAAAIARTLILDTKNHIAKINRDSDADYVSAAVKHVDDVRNAIIQDELHLSELRQSSGIQDPDIYYSTMLEESTKLETQGILDKAQYKSITSETPNNPVANALKTQMSVIDEGITGAQKRINSLSVVSQEYEAIKIRLKVDTELLTEAQAALQQSQMKASQNHYYMSVISAPSAPQAAEKPYSTIIIAVVLILSVVLWPFI